MGLIKLATSWSFRGILGGFMGFNRHSGAPQESFKACLAGSRSFRGDPGGLRKLHRPLSELQRVPGDFRDVSTRFRTF